LLPGLHATATVWWLELDSELLFVGDAGNTEASNPSRRLGVELANVYRVNDWLLLDADLAFTDAKFTRDVPGGGDEIPGALSTVVAAGATVDLDSGLFGSVRLRYFGERELVEDGSVESDPTTIVNLRTGYRRDDWEVAVDVLNLFDSDDDDITYFYTSRLPGEPAGGVDDIHFHPVEPLTVRFSVSYWF